VHLESLKGQWNAVALATLLLLAFSFAFGGASQQHTLRLAMVELAALPLLVIAASRLIALDVWTGHRFAYSLLGGLIALPLLQLLPLPPSVWTMLPGRSDAALALDLAGITPGWVPLSLTPDLTRKALLAIIPPTAMFFGVMATSISETRRLIILCLFATIVSIALGLLQLMSGTDRFYPWETTSAGSVTGFFANRNHLATLLLVMVPFAMVLSARSLGRHSGSHMPLWLGCLFVGISVVALAAIRSRAGLVLIVPVAATSLVAAWIAAGRGRPKAALLGIFGTLAATVMAVALFALPPILARFDTTSAPEGRFERWPLVATAAEPYLPVGAGIGSFDAVFRSVEPLDQLDGSFFNHAHNEYLETWLEAGWLGLALVLAFIVWFSRRAWSAWTAPPSSDADMQRAASVGIAVLLVHSVGDYPLRTATMAVIFALLSGILELAPVVRSRGSRSV